MSLFDLQLGGYVEGVELSPEVPKVGLLAAFSRHCWLAMERQP
ncbi:MAG: hypothetical protein RLY14_2194 [Planctomycetota bacterium]|jgi:hypothetical protein